MLQALRRHLPIVLTAVVTATVFAAGPTVARAAFDAVNSDKVDGKHAVGSGASIEQRKKKLVATSRRGRLPNNIIAKAPDADKVDGIDSSVLLDRYTRAQVDAMPSRRLLGFGSVSAGGVLAGNSYFPGGSSEKALTGIYLIKLPGYAPGCSRPFPTVMATPMWGPGETYTGSGSMNCGSGDLFMQVNTANSAGTGVDKAFAFTFFSGDGQVPAPTARQRAGADVCELTQDGVRCR